MELKAAKDGAKLYSVVHITGTKDEVTLTDEEEDGKLGVEKMNGLDDGVDVDVVEELGYVGVTINEFEAATDANVVFAVVLNNGLLNEDDNEDISDAVYAAFGGIEVFLNKTGETRFLPSSTFGK